MIKLITLIVLIQISLFSQDKPKMLWFDATANFERFSYLDSIQYYLDRTKALGFTDVVVDVKPITGEVLYPSSFAPEMKEWKGFERPSELDFFNTFIKEAKKRDLVVHASVNVFVAGHNYFDRGIVYTDKPEWQSLNYTDSGFVPITQLKHKYSAMTNPANPVVQEYELSIIKEIVANYNIDGIILDRVRYDAIQADFSELSKSLFENYIDAEVIRYPQDIYEWIKDDEGNPVRKDGKFFKQWIEWRASIIYDFIKKAREEVKNINPNIIYGDYTGAWYPVYFELGVNWASRNYDPSKEYEWATENYKNFGYAELLDLYTTGCYFFEVTKEEVELANIETLKRSEAGMGLTKEYWYSVEGSAELAMEVVMGAVPVWGGLYVEQYAGHPEQFQRAVKMCLDKTDGLMIFDIVHIINYNWWNVLEGAMK